VGRSIQGDQGLDKKSRNWVICAVLTALVFMFLAIDDCSVEDNEAGLCETDESIAVCGSLSCLGALGFAALALMTKKDGENQIIVVQQQPPTQVIQVQQPVVQQPQPQYRVPPPQSQYRAPPPQPQYRAPPPPAREVAKAQSAEHLRKQAHLERGHKLEMEGDLGGAITAYELAEEFREAQRVRWALGKSDDEDGNGPSNVNISIGKVGDTSVKDSVITEADDEI